MKMSGDSSRSYAESSSKRSSQGSTLGGKKVEKMRR